MKDQATITRPRELAVLMGLLCAIVAVGCDRSRTEVQPSSSAQSISSTLNLASPQELASQLKQLNKIEPSGNLMTWSPDGRYIAAMGSNGLESSPAEIWDTIEARVVLSFTVDKPVAAIAWSPDGNRLALASDSRDNNPIVELFDLASGQKLTEYTGFAPEVGRPTAMLWSPDGSTLAVTVSADQIRLLDATTGREKYSETGLPVRFADGITWSPDGSKFVSTSASVEYNSQEVALWDAATGKMLRSLSGVASDYRQLLRWSPDGSTLAIADLSKTALWDTSTWQKKLTIRREVRDVEWSADGKILATLDKGQGSGFIPARDGILRMWDAGTGKELRAPFENRAVGEIRWSPVGHTLALISRDIEFWGIEDDAHVRSNPIVQPGSKRVEQSQAEITATDGTSPHEILAKLKDASGLQIEDTMSWGEPTRHTYIKYELARQTDRFIGKAQFYADVEGKGRRTHEEDVSVSQEHVEAFLANLSSVVLEPGPYEPKHDYGGAFTYSHIKIEIQVEGKSVLFSSASDGEDRVPWRATVQGKTFVVRAAMPTQAVNSLKPHIKWDLLTSMLKEIEASP